MSGVAALVIGLSTIVGQTDSGMPEELRQHIEKHIIGEWTSTTTWDGKVTHAESRSRWAQGGKCVITEREEVDFSGNRVHVTTIHGWDAQAKCPVDYSVTSKGEFWKFRWTDAPGDEWSGEGSGFYEGKPWSSPAKIQWKKDGSRYEDTTEGKPFVIVSKRKVSHVTSPEGATDVPKGVLRQFKHFVGEWTVKGTTSEGKPAEAKLSVRWAPSKTSLLFDAEWSEPGLKSLGSGIFGWDAAEQRVHVSEFWDNNVYHHRHFAITSDHVWEGHEFSGVNKDGQRLCQKVRFEIKSPNEWTYTASDLIVDGQPEEGDVTLTFKRK